MSERYKMRKPEYPVHELILRRWSPRAMSGERISKESLMSLFEAARWAPSSYNEQEWRFLWAGKGTPHWDTFFSLLVEANQVWCAQGSHLIVLLYKETFTQTGEKNGVAQLDAGAAMQNLLLQATELGLVAHPMGGFDWTRAVELLEVPSGFAVGAMIVVGHPAAPETLPKDLQNMESPSGRKELCEFVSEGLFSFES